MSGKSAAPISGKSSSNRPEPVKVQRYRKGKAPEYAAESTVEDFTSNDRKETRTQKPFGQPKSLTLVNSSSSRSELPKTEPKAPVADRRLQRLANAQNDNVESEDVDVPRRRRRRPVYEGEIVQTSTVEEGKKVTNEESEDNATIRRERIRQKAEEAQQQPIVELVEEKSSTSLYEKEDDNDESSSEEEEEEEEQILFKPVFVPKKNRDTLVDEDQLALDREDRENQKAEMKREESIKMLAKQVKKDLLGPEIPEAEWNSVDDTDDLDPDAEYNAWKLRELNRIKRDKEERERFILEQEEIEKRREMSDEQRREDDLAAGIDRFKREKSKMKFLQKYYHKGAFFQEEEILQRDYTAPTLEDQFNKESLPQVMQVKNFGKSGQSKWTHLANEDTSKRDALWLQDEQITQKMTKRMGGMHDMSMDRPAAKRRKD